MWCRCDAAGPHVGASRAPVGRAAYRPGLAITRPGQRRSRLTPRSSGKTLPGSPRITGKNKIKTMGCVGAAFAGVMMPRARTPNLSGGRSSPVSLRLHQGGAASDLRIGCSVVAKLAYGGNRPSVPRTGTLRQSALWPSWARLVHPDRHGTMQCNVVQCNAM